MRGKLSLALLASLAIAGCGTAPRPQTGPHGTRCLQGTMGGCVPRPAQRPALPNLSGLTLVPDISEYNGCAVYSEAIFRVYEAGTGRQDAKAACHAHELQRRHVWSAAYSFLRPGHGGCAYQAERTVAIVRSVGGITGPIVADAEVYLPPGFVSCFNRVVRSEGYAAVTYTAPGTWPGGPFNTRVWVAAYPYRPPCFSNACPYVAHQFADAVNCRGVYGDCSINEGILGITNKPTPSPQRHAELVRALRLQAELDRDLANHHCRTIHGRQAFRLCPRWGQAWRAVGTTIQRLRSEGA